MPVTRRKAITWKCRDCMVSFTSEDREELKTKGFAHQVSNHNLVEQNREFFMNGHFGNFYEIT